MKTALYAGSFNPWHLGHTDILRKSLMVFDKVLVAVGKNPDKATFDYNLNMMMSDFAPEVKSGVVENHHFEFLLVDFIKELAVKGTKVDAVIRGLRSAKDLQFEQEQQYWNEDLGIEVPTIYFVSDRKLVHISSSYVRAVNRYEDAKKIKDKIAAGWPH